MKIELSSSSMKNLIVLSSFIFLYLPLSSFIFLLCVFFHYLTKPRNYEDCVLANLKGDERTMAVGLIDDMCEAKFPRKIND